MSWEGIRRQLSEMVKQWSLEVDAVLSVWEPADGLAQVQLLAEEGPGIGVADHHRLIEIVWAFLVTGGCGPSSSHRTAWLAGHSTPTPTEAPIDANCVARWLRAPSLGPDLDEILAINDR